MRLALKLSLLLLVASCFTPGQDKREKLFIESVASHRNGGKCVKWSHGPLYCWGRYAGLPTAEFLSGPYLTSPEPVTLEGLNTADIVQMEATYGTLCARLTHGALQCWGSGDGQSSSVEYYELGRGVRRLPSNSNLLYTPVPEPVVGLGDVGTLAGVTSIAAGDGTFCAVFGDQGELACWGVSGGDYRLGVDRTVVASAGASTTPGSPTPLAVEAADRPVGSQAKLRGAARLVSAWVVLMRDGTLVTWSNGFRAIISSHRGHYLGRGFSTAGAIKAPGRVLPPRGRGFLSDVRTASASPVHTCAAVGEATTVYCWGRNSFGEVGNGSTAPAARPVEVLPPAKAASLGRILGIITPESRTCTINAQLKVFCWGYNRAPPDVYRLGTIDNIVRPTRVLRNARVIALYGRRDSLCFNYVGNFKCVGRNGFNESNLGIGIAGALTGLGFGDGDDTYGNHDEETLARAPFLEFPGVPE